MAAPGGISAFLLAAAEYLPSYWLLLAASPSAPKGVHKLKLHDLQTYMIGFAVAIFYRVCLALVLAQQQAKMQPLTLRCKNNSVLELCRECIVGNVRHSNLKLHDL